MSEVLEAANIIEMVVVSPILPSGGLAVVSEAIVHEWIAIE